MPKTCKVLISSLSIIFLVCNIAIAGGLSTTFVQVKLKDLKLDRTYSVKRETGKELIIKNTTESMTVDIGIKPEKPTEATLVPGYEPIPDLSWIRIRKSYFKGVGPGKSAKTDILVSIPDDEEYAGKKYQVYIYSHTAGEATFRTGLMSRLLIETEEVPLSVEKLIKKK